MTRLNTTALATLRAAGVSVAEWKRRNRMGDMWFGDACGCPDNRCIGHHHYGGDDCECLSALLMVVDMAPSDEEEQ